MLVSCRPLLFTGAQAGLTQGLAATKATTRAGDKNRSFVGRRRCRVGHILYRSCWPAPRTVLGTPTDEVTFRHFWRRPIHRHGFARHFSFISRMGLTSAAVATPSVIPEMPQTPKKQLGDGAPRSPHKLSTSTAVGDQVSDSDGKQQKNACGSDSPQRRQQPYMQNNIDRYFTPQTTPSTQSSQPLPQQAQTLQSDPPVVVPAVVDVKGSSANVNECNASANASSSNSSSSNDKPQKENVPDSTKQPSTKKGQRGKPASMKRRGGGTRPTAAVRSNSKTREPRAQRKQTPSQKQMQQQQSRQSDVSDVGGAAGKNDDQKDVKRITDYFQLRRSHRRTKGEMIKCKQMLMEEKVLQADETGFQIVKFEDKGRGVVSNMDLKTGDFVLEYAGDLIDLKEARRREELYMRDTSVGCYMYYFQHENANHCVDATLESDRLGRLINHSIRSANLKTKSATIGGIPRLVFVAKRDIRAGEELLYDYGDRSKESLQSHPWLRN
ncbi:N-lysine methyltransferase SETD8-like [Tropilaelaps mercedesae]|uniref:[histone H4]-lysine(20) N-methyltransferase n=1 Tax=Tropilaelaps mercedesae TaxID=418985 RepID=A0A1V9X544_9ACAR|nr:N-lysine methyltransferase SETD8-like [Tropilaelaps mercedesae]